MALVIPPFTSNWIITIQNNVAGESAFSSIAIGMGHQTQPLTQATVDRVSAIVRGKLALLYDDSWRIGPIKVLEGTTLGPQVWFNYLENGGAANTTPYSSPAVAQIVSKLTAFSGRRFRGRVYLPGVPDAMVNEGGVIDTARVDFVQGRFNELLTELEADAAIDGVALFHDSSTPSTGAQRVVAFKARNIVGTMRPRQRR